MEANKINFTKTYSLNAQYEQVIENIHLITKLRRYIGHSKPIHFNSNKRQVEFVSEQLIPKNTHDCPNIMFLFSNPHPHSIEQGMFLSPNRNNVENKFWSFMEDAEWFKIKQSHPSPKERGQLFLKREYESKFNFIFYCYYDFPSNYPTELKKIFGSNFFSKVIDPEAKKNFKKIISKHDINSILVLNKEIYNLVADVKLKTYISTLNEGKLIKGYTSEADLNIPIYLSYPTGWYYVKNIQMLRKNSLSNIKNDIIKYSC